MNDVRLCIAVLASLAALSGCGRGARDGGISSQADVAPATRAANEREARAIPTSAAESLANARRGFIAKPTGQVRSAAGAVILDFAAFDFVAGEPPPTVNPSLWRQAILNNQLGLFEVADRIWQLRGFDLANMTLIEGDTDWVVKDSPVNGTSAMFCRLMSDS